MNLINNRQLDKSERQVIYEITLKKRQSKKSTMSKRHLMAKQQLARELMQERIFPMGQSEDFPQTNTNLDLNLNLNHFHSIPAYMGQADSEGSFRSSSDLTHTDSFVNSILSSSSCSQASLGTDNRPPLQRQPHHFNHQEQQQANLATSHHPDPPEDQAPMSELSSVTSTCTQPRAPKSGSSCAQSFSRSESDYSVISRDEMSEIVGLASSPATLDSRELSEPGSQQTPNHQATLDTSHEHDEDQPLRLQRKKEANIKFLRSRLDHLNGELERRLYQYEYLVAQEKALLGSYNMVLFANRGVNNFQLHDESKSVWCSQN